MGRFGGRVTYANVMSTLAVFLMIGGGAAIALPGKNTVDSGDVKNNTLTSADVKNNSLKSADLKDGKAVTGADVVDDSLTGADISEGSLAEVPSAATANKADTADDADTVDGREGELNAVVAPNCESLVHGNGVEGVDLPFSARCDVRFDRNLTECAAQATVMGGNDAEDQINARIAPHAVTAFAGLDDDEVAVTFRSADGALDTSGRPGFYLTVFC